MRPTRSFTANWGGTCSACDRRFPEGTQIVGDGFGDYMHLECPEDSNEVVDAQALRAPRCTSCGLNHPGEC